MRKLLAGSLLGILLFGVEAGVASAVEMRISPWGFLSVYQDGVLGETDAAEEENEEPEYEKEAVEAVEVRSEERVEVKNEGDNLRIRVEEKNRELASEAKKKQLEQLKETNAKRLKLQVPAGMRTTNVDRLIQAEKEVLESKLRSLTDLPEATREAKKQELEAGWETRKSELEELKELRSERLNEYLELKNKLGGDGRQILELSSRNVRAELKGADFAFDPETNQVILTTPSGNEHILKHLPDQALERFREKAGVILPTDPDAPEVEVESGADGEVVYTTTAEAEKRLLGVFSRKVKTRLMLHDTTGEITEQPIAGDSFIERLLNAWTF